MRRALWVVIALGLPAASSARVISVGPGGMYPTISDGIAAAGSGDTIEVAAGVYVEEILIVDLSVELVGLGGAGVVFIESPGVGSPDLIRVVGGEVCITGFTVDGRGERRGVSVHQGAWVELNDAVITGGVNADGFPGGGIGVWSLARVDATSVALLDNNAYLGSMPFGGQVSVEQDSTLELRGNSSLVAGGAGRGGGIYVDATSTADVVETLFADNHTSGPSDHDGGAICAEPGSGLAVADSIFENNTTAPDPDSDGGAIYASDAEIYTSVFEYNGGAQHGGGVAIFSTQLVADGNLFVGNDADFGAALSCASAVCEVYGSWFEGNMGLSGGALWFDDNIELIRNHFCQNRATATNPGLGLGGAVLAVGGVLYGTNNVFVDNAAEVQGGAVALDGVHATLINNHFVGNVAVDGGAVHLRGAGAELAGVNNLYGWNSSSVEGAGLASTSYSLYFMNSDNDPQGGTGDLHGVDPLLVAPRTGTCSEPALYPLRGSPLINGGDPSRLDPDQTWSDIGAFGGPGASENVYKDLDGDSEITLFDCDDDDPVQTGPYVYVYVDADDDDYGDFTDPGMATCMGANLSTNNLDCDDTDPYSHEGPIWFEDVDGDGLGDPATGTAFCVQPSGWVATGTDCDDADPSVGEASLWFVDQDRDGFGDPGTGAAVCVPAADQVDNDLDCDDSLYEIGEPQPLHEDADGDGYGAQQGPVLIDCPRSGWVENSGDCDDTDIDINPDTVWYHDGDDDGVGGVESGVQCEAPPDAVRIPGDCDDADADVGLPSPHYLDSDEDGWGSEEQVTSCPGDGLTEQTGDCRDGDPQIYPGAPETCDDVDSDCDGDLGDPESVDAVLVHEDADGDGYGNPRTAVMGCVRGSWGIDGTDCDDADPGIHPGAEEIWYDDIDQDCDGASDHDQDGDGFDAAQSVDGGEDCDDQNAEHHPGATDVPDDGIDQNCDGVVAATWIVGGGVGCQTVPLPVGWLTLVGLALAVLRRGRD